MNISLITLFFLFGIAFCQNCDLEGPFTCSGGIIQGIDFGDDEDDDYFEYFFTNGDNSCTVIQEGTYEVDGEMISVEFEIDDDECLITGDDASCNCVESLEFTSSDNCVTINGPNGEICTPANSKY